MLSIFCGRNFRKAFFLALLSLVAFSTSCGVSKASWESQTDMYETDGKVLRKTPERSTDILIQP